MQNHASSDEVVVHTFHYLLVDSYWQRSEYGLSDEGHERRCRHTLTLSVESGVPMLLAGSYLIVNIPVYGMPWRDVRFEGRSFAGLTEKGGDGFGDASVTTCVKLV